MFLVNSYNDKEVIPMSEKLSYLQKRKNKKAEKKAKKLKDKEKLESLKAEAKALEDKLNNIAKKQTEFEKEVLRKASFLDMQDELSLIEKNKYYKNILDFTNKICSNIPDYENIEDKESRNVENVCKDFYEQYDKLNKYIHISENGLKGERYTYNALKMLDYKVEILQNINLYLGNEIIENDIIVITESGVFTLEVKYVSNKTATITEQGLLGNKNIVEQSRKHIHSLNRLFVDTKYADIPVYSIIVFSNDKCKVYCHNDYVTVCYRNDVEDIIFDEHEYPKAISKDDMIAIKDVICESSKDIPSIKYPLDVDMDAYINSLAKYVSFYEIIQYKESLEKEVKELKKKISDLEGVTFADVLVAIGALAVLGLFTNND